MYTSTSRGTTSHPCSYYRPRRHHNSSAIAYFSHHLSIQVEMPLNHPTSIYIITRELVDLPGRLIVSVKVVQDHRPSLLAPLPSGAHLSTNRPTTNKTGQGSLPSRYITPDNHTIVNILYQAHQHSNTFIKDSMLFTVYHNTQHLTFISK